ncbi:low temperature requirement protein A [Hamadaea tsunoensis]|uniref:low temperature requirement protein A n=1 Tax=Hamadaea tsunoensis TaxID=53368 RepID=UPI0003F6E163|nr:low temperature requirement protein A [Hamadaea tsunoensis]
MTETTTAPRASKLHDWEPLRRATWLELFCDLVFVVAVARLGALLHTDHSVRGFLAFAGLFVAVWWLWLSFSYFADLFDDDGPLQRLTQLVAALGAAILAVTVDGDIRAHSARFAAIFAVLLLLLTVMYAWTGAREPRAAELCRWYTAGSGIGAALWAISILVPVPGRYAVWAVALVANATVSGPLAYAKMREAPRQVSHMPERFGLFVLVVLGEAVWSTVTGITEGSWSPGAVTVAVSGFVIAASMWWIYFLAFDEEAISRVLSQSRTAQVRSFLYGYGHLIVYVAIVASGVGVELAAEAAAHGHRVTLPLFGVAQALLIAGFVTVSNGVGLELGVPLRTQRMFLALKLVIAVGGLVLSLWVALPALVVAATAVAWAVLTAVEVGALERVRKRSLQVIE